MKRINQMEPWIGEEEKHARNGGSALQRDGPRHATGNQERDKRDDAGQHPKEQPPRPARRDIEAPVVRQGFAQVREESQRHQAGDHLGGIPGGEEVTHPGSERPTDEVHERSQGQRERKPDSDVDQALAHVGQSLTADGIGWGRL